MNSTPAGHDTESPPDSAQSSVELKDRITALQQQVEDAQSRRTKLLSQLMSVQKDLVHRKTTEVGVLETAWANSVREELTEAARRRAELNVILEHKKATVGRIVKVRSVLAAAEAREEARRQNLCGDLAEEFIRTEAVRLLEEGGDAIDHDAEERRRHIGERATEVAQAHTEAERAIAEQYRLIHEEATQEEIDAAELPDFGDDELTKRFGQLLEDVGVPEAELHAARVTLAGLTAILEQTPAPLPAPPTLPPDDHPMYSVIADWVTDVAVTVVRQSAVQAQARALMNRPAPAAALAVGPFGLFSQPQVAIGPDSLSPVELLLRYLDDRDRQQQVAEMADRTACLKAEGWEVVRGRRGTGMLPSRAMQYTSRAPQPKTGRPRRRAGEVGVSDRMEFILTEMTRGIRPSPEHTAAAAKTAKAARKADDEGLAMVARSTQPGLIPFMRHVGAWTGPTREHTPPLEEVAADLAVLWTLDYVVHAIDRTAKEAMKDVKSGSAAVDAVMGAWAGLLARGRGAAVIKALGDPPAQCGLDTAVG